MAIHAMWQEFNKSRIEREIKVIYDAAHAFGVKLQGESILLHGDCSALSFHATKVFHTAEGGAVVCRSRRTRPNAFFS